MFDDRLFHGIDEPLAQPKRGPADSFLAALFASVLAQAGVASFLAERRRIGWALMGAGASILIWRLKASGILTEKRMRWLLAMALLGIFGGAGLVLLQKTHGGGFAEDTPKAATDLGAGKYRGVILWTEMKPPPVLVAPRPSFGRGVNQPKQTLSIPFDGVYWFYKFPDRQPPKDSYSARGSPSATVFRSADAYPLQMEARQNFITPVDLSCCNRVEVEIVNADRTPGAVSLELTVANQRLPGEPSQSLGRVPVTSTPLQADGVGVQPATEILSFAVPPNSRILQFDSARVRFLRAGAQNVSSARIAVQRFILVPRGL